MNENVVIARKSRTVGVRQDYPAAYMTRHRNEKIRNISANGCALSAVDLLIICAESGDLPYKDAIDNKIALKILGDSKIEMKLLRKLKMKDYVFSMNVAEFYLKTLRNKAFLSKMYSYVFGDRIEAMKEMLLESVDQIATIHQVISDGVPISTFFETKIFGALIRESRSYVLSRQARMYRIDEVPGVIEIDDALN